MRIRSFDIAPDGKLLAACSTDGLCLWDMATGTRQATFNGHRGIVTTVAFSPDGSALISAAHDGTVLVWDVARLIAAPALKPLAVADLESLWKDLSAPYAVDMPTENGPTKQHQMYSVFLDAHDASVTINGRPLKGRVAQRDFAGTRKSTAFLAFSESWMKTT